MAEAVTLSKQRNAIFVVFVEGKPLIDENILWRPCKIFPTLFSPSAIFYKYLYFSNSLKNYVTDNKKKVMSR